MRVVILALDDDVLVLARVTALAGVLLVGPGQVREMGASGVMDEIERIAVETALSIVGGKGFGFRVPTRSSGNQKYVEELDRIVLGDKVTRTILLTLQPLQNMSYSMIVPRSVPKTSGAVQRG